MGEFVAGSVVVPVVPDAGGFHKALAKLLVPGAYKVGQDVGKEIGRGISESLRGVYAPLTEQTERHKQQAPRDGDQVGGAFARGFKARLEAAFQSLPKARLDADATPAQTRLAELRARMSELSDKTINVDLDAGAAIAEVRAIESELAQLGGKDATIDVRADVAAALAELRAVQAELSGVDGRTARARVDVDVSGALGALGALSAALAGVAAIPVAAGLAAGVGALVGPLGAAGAGFAGVAAVAVPSMKRIGEALKEQEKAASSAAGATGTAAQATTSAAQAAAEAASRGAALEQAERRITDAKVAAKAAEEGLTEARRAAKEAAEDLARSVANAALSEESAALSVEEARERLAKLQTDAQKPDSKVTDLEMRRAELAVREAEQRHKDAKDRAKDLRTEQAASDKAGVEGSKQVVAAKDKIKKANQAIADSEAQLKLLRLQQAAAKEKPKAAPAAKPAVEASKFSKLSPAAQSAAKQVKAFGDAYEAWQKKLEPAVLPLITGGLKIVQKLFKPLTPLVTGSTEALAGLQEAAAKALNPKSVDGKFWADFFTKMSDAAPQAITGLGTSLGSVVTGIAGVIKAFLPFVPTVVGGIQKAASAFATWGKGLSGSQGFTDFIAYVQANVPKIITIISNVGTVIGELFQGAPSAGSGVLDVLVSFTDWLAGLSPGQLQAVALGIAGIWAAVKGWKIITTAVDGVKKGIQTTRDVAAGAKKVWSGISDAATGAWNLAKKAGSGIATAAQAAGRGGARVASAVWSGIGTAASKAAQVAKSSAGAVAGAVRTAGSATARGGAAAWDGIRLAATRAASMARVAGTAVLTAGRTAAVAAVGIGRAALAWTAMAVQAGIARARVLAAAAAQGIVRAATMAWAAGQAILNIALNANPIGLIITAIGLLVAGLVYAYNNSETFRSIITAAWEGIQAAVSWAWENVIKPAVEALVAFWQNVLAPAATWLWQKILKPAWDGIGAVVKTVWETVVKPALDALHKMIFTTIPDGFQKGVALIGKWWEGLKDVAKAPVKFIVDTVYTGGIKKVWDAVADTLKLPKLPAIAFARGGIYPGYTPGRDTGVAAVSGGEAIMRPEWTRAVGEAYVHKANAAARGGGVAGVARFLGQVGDPGTAFFGGFAGGGVVGDLLAKGIKVGAEAFLNPILDRAAAAMGNSPWATMLASVPKMLVSKVIDFLGAKEEASGAGGAGGAGKAVAYARAQIGKPYRWGATGPDAFDCSGLVMRAWQAATGKLMPRVTQDQINWVKPVTTPSPGDLGFPHSGHVWIYSSKSSIIEAPYTGATVREGPARAAQVMGRVAFDSGGYLPTGESLVYNGTGRPEPVLTDRQWQDITISGAAGGPGGTGAPLLNIEGDYNAPPNASPYELVQEMRFMLGAELLARGPRR